jgi:hypothetical protein
MQRFFGCVEIAEQPDQRCKHATAMLPVDGVEGLVRSVRHHSFTRFEIRSGALRYCPSSRAESRRDPHCLIHIARLDQDETAERLLVSMNGRLSPTSVRPARGQSSPP